MSQEVFHVWNVFDYLGFDHPVWPLDEHGYDGDSTPERPVKCNLLCHRLAIVGEGDIVDTNNSGRGCTLEQFQAGNTACTENKVNGDYFVNYKAEPRPGWRFVRWDGPCRPDSNFQHCRLEVSKDTVDWWDKTYPDKQIPRSTAVFQLAIGETGYLLAGTAVAGVAYETLTQQGVTGIDGSFQYEEGEAVRFMIDDTLLGEVIGKAQVTPFDLAGSAVVSGTPDITGAQKDEDEPSFRRLVNIAVLLQSLDQDADGEPDYTKIETYQYQATGWGHIFSAADSYSEILFGP